MEVLDQDQIDSIMEEFLNNEVNLGGPPGSGSSPKIDVPPTCPRCVYGTKRVRVKGNGKLRIEIVSDLGMTDFRGKLVGGSTICLRCGGTF